jgi:hypothetical protein
MKSNITEVECLKYEMVRASGVTNMWDINKVKILSGLPKPVILEIMQNYGDLNKKFKFRQKEE